TLFADLERVRQSLSGAGLAFPLIAKPDVGHNRLCRIDDALALREYLRHFPAGEKLILQRFVPDSGEAAVPYARLPGAQSGRILSLTFPTGEHWRGATRHFTPERATRLGAPAPGMGRIPHRRLPAQIASPRPPMRR